MDSSLVNSLDNSIIRLNMKQKRQGLSDDDVNALSFSCFERLCQQPVFQNAKKIGIYTDARNEVKTSEIIVYLWQQNKEVYVPKCKASSKMDFYRIKSFDDLAIGSYQLLEPKKECLINNKLDLIICPLVAFDTHHYRLGMGKGYYDRFLAQYPTYTIGLAYSFQKADFEVYSHDQKLDLIITDKEVL